MNFWETVAGHRLADCLVRTLPSLADKAERTQYTLVCESMEEAIQKTQEAIGQGHFYVDSMQSAEKILVILEK